MGSLVLAGASGLLDEEYLAKINVGLMIELIMHAGFWPSCSEEDTQKKVLTERKSHRHPHQQFKSDHRVWSCADSYIQGRSDVHVPPKSPDILCKPFLCLVSLFAMYSCR